MKNKNLESGFKTLLRIRTAATGLFGYLALISEGDFIEEDIPGIVKDLNNQIPAIKSRISMLQQTFRVATKPKTIIPELCTELLQEMDQLSEMLENDNSVPASKNWKEEIKIIKHIIRNISYILEQFKKMGYEITT